MSWSLLCDLIEVPFAAVALAFGIVALVAFASVKPWRHW